ncbi:MAG: ABC transporter ATP-binding protein [Ruminococcaceae bacterium]|nr:ABC transporter ATP-binding protein [Oscillospiraceae bacterium]
MVEVANLGKNIRGVDIVRDISFSVEKRDILGFLGPNGAGKSTTIKMMLGLVKPTNGEVKLGGYDIRTQRESALENVGAMVESPAFYTYMTGYQNLSLYANLYGLGRERIDEVLNLVHLYDDRNKKVGKYSMGMKQRLGIARAFLNSPSLIILDEPTNGLDPVGIIEIRNIIKNLAETQGITFIICSHILSEVETMCNKLLIINRGEMIAFGSLKELMQSKGSHSLEEYYLNVLGLGENV